MPRLIAFPPFAPVVFVERKILLRLGYRKGLAGVSQAVRAMIAEETGRAGKLVRPQAAAVVLEKEEIPCHPVFRGAERAALCVCTIGPELETAAARLIEEGEMLRGLTLDWLGSEAVVHVSRQAADALAGVGRHSGLRPSKMFSPGDKGWDVSGQALIFGTVPAASIGVRLSESFMMTPRKSFSFRINFCAEGISSAGKRT